LVEILADSLVSQIKTSQKNVLESKIEEMRRGELGNREGMIDVVF